MRGCDDDVEEGRCGRIDKRAVRVSWVEVGWKQSHVYQEIDGSRDFMITWSSRRLKRVASAFTEAVRLFRNSVPSLVILNSSFLCNSYKCTILTNLPGTFENGTH